MSFEGTVAVIGLGYIGLPTSAVMASESIRVTGVDIDSRVVELVGQGKVPISEPGLDHLVAEKVEKGYLTSSSVVPETDVFIIAVPTPFKNGNEPDISYVLDAASSIAPRLRRGSLVIVESTCPPGTTHQVAAALSEERPDLKFPLESAEPDVFVAHCPERVLPGRILSELVSNDRVVGGISKDCADKAAEVYGAFCEGEIFKTDAVSAEMAKLAENSFRDVNIAFANELANISEQQGTDVWEVIRLANRHPRVNILSPGPGVGGHCIAVDPWFLAAAAPGEAVLIPAARGVNNSRPEKIVSKIVDALSDLQIDGPAIVGCFGLAFKANVDDLRESPAVDVVQRLSQRDGVRVLAVEPYIDTLPGPLQSAGVELVSSKEAIEGSDLIVMLVDHRDFDALRNSSDVLERPRVDTRGFWHGG